MRKKLVIILFLLSSCSNPSAARRTLEASGFDQIETLGWGPFSCGKDDFFSTKFRARKQGGGVIEGVVCGGPFKGYTVRFE